MARTFSKAYGLAALRVGYGIASAQIASVLNRVRPPFNVNSLAMTAAAAALNDSTGGAAQHRDQYGRLAAVRAGF